MKMKAVIQIMFAAAAAFTIQACTSATAETTKPSKEKEAAMKTFIEIPREEIVEDVTLMAELQGRYKQNLTTLRDKINVTGAKFVVFYLSPEVGVSQTATQRLGRPFIEQTCQELGIEYADMTTTLVDKDPLVFTQMPKDGHWSKVGAQMIAENVSTLIEAHSADRSTATFTDRPALFGDQKPNQDAVLDGGKDLPYRLQTNAQGLRMGHDVAFPKTKQRILFMGDSGFFFPFLDNKDTGTELLQQKFQNTEILNACNWGYGIDDYISLFEERAKFSEPDVVMLQTGGGDILDAYFSHRNRFSRSPNPVQPSATEKAFYEKTFKK